MDPELVSKVESECLGGIDEKNSANILCTVITVIRGYPCTCDGITRKGFHLAVLCEGLPDDKGVFTHHLQIMGKMGFTSCLASLRIKSPSTWRDTNSYI